ncbi:hypothetical protein [Chitinophaga jiangningensis]|nr:hypothetical protein [Chitinophaga jiangningensis]
MNSNNIRSEFPQAIQKRLDKIELWISWIKEETIHIQADWEQLSAPENSTNQTSSLSEEEMKALMDKRLRNITIQ